MKIKETKGGNEIFVSLPPSTKTAIELKNITNSKGFLTGVLNLIIERAPTIPNDRAILEEIEEVIVKPIGASNTKFNSWFVECTHSNFIKLNEI